MIAYQANYSHITSLYQFLREREMGVGSGGRDAVIPHNKAKVQSFLFNKT